MGDPSSTNYQGAAAFSGWGLPNYVIGFTPNLPAPPSTTRTRAEIGSGANASASTNYQGRGAFSAQSGDATSTNYGLIGVPPYVRGMQNGMGVHVSYFIFEPNSNHFRLPKYERLCYNHART